MQTLALLGKVALGTVAIAILSQTCIACSRSHNPPSAQTLQAEAESPATNSDPEFDAPVDEAIVIIQGFQFKPAQVTLRQGGSVTFINQDSAPHTATPKEGSLFTGTGRLQRDESAMVEFSTVGEQDYFCEIHPSMQGVITVVE